MVNAAGAPSTKNLTAKRRSLHKITVNVLQKNWTALHEAARTTGDSQTDSVNRALAFYARAIAITDQGGAVYFREEDGAKLERVTFL